LEQPDLAPDHKVELEALLAQLTQAEKEVDTVDLQKQFHQVKKAFETQERPIKVEEHPEMAKTSEEKTDQVDRTQDTGSLAGDQQAKEPTAAQTPGEETGDGERGRDAQREAKITVVDRRTDDTSTGQQVNQDPAVKTTPVKANDLPLEQLVKQHKVFEQVKTGVMDQVVKGTVQLDDGSSEMTLRLKPAQLGEVHLKLSIEKGVVLAEMRVASEVVKQAIESQLADLKQSLSDKGFGVGGLNVSVNKDQTDGRGGQPRHQQTRRPIVLRPEKDTIPYDAFDYVEAGINAIDYLG
jgi:flagellar hook-length control protein FliK